MSAVENIAGGSDGTAAEGGNASRIIAVLRTLMGVCDGSIAPSVLLESWRSVFPFERAALIAPGLGTLRFIAVEPAQSFAPFPGGATMRQFSNPKIVGFGEDKSPIGLAGFVALEDCVLIMPVGVAGRTATAVFVRSNVTAPFDDPELTMARLGSAVSLASVIARKAGAGDPAASLEIHDRQLLKMILDHLPISLTVQDSGGRFILANALAIADLAVSAERLLGSSPADFLSEKEAISRRQWEQSVVAGGKTITAETRVTDAEGERILLTSHTPVFITNNTLLISSAVDITKHKEIERRLTERAHIDKLTGLPDRVRIEEYVESIIASPERRPFALAFIDLDNFKHVNDYYNHAVGDALLKQISERMKSRLQPGDMLARISGDEFMLLLDGFENMDAVSDSIDQVLADLKRPFYLEGFEIFSSCSIGVSFYPAHGSTYETLRRNADGAMYGAKGRAKGQAMYFDDGLGKAIAARMEAEQRLRLAIRDRRFVCAFQPKIDIHTQQVDGFETLVRWRDSDGEIHPPGQFINLAIELGLINPITNFVLTETLNSIDRLDAAFGTGTSISINIGAKQTGDIAFMGALVETIKNSGRAERLILELTEDAIVEQGVFQSDILPILRANGVRYPSMILAPAIRR